MTSKELIAGDTISILIGSATAHCAVATTMVHGRITRTTEKAVRIEAWDENGDYTGRECWFPRKALTKVEVFVEGHKHHSAKLAHWFRPTGYTADWIRFNSDVSVISA